MVLVFLAGDESFVSKEILAAAPENWEVATELNSGINAIIHIGMSGLNQTFDYMEKNVTCRVIHIIRDCPGMVRVVRNLRYRAVLVDAYCEQDYESILFRMSRAFILEKRIPELSGHTGIAHISQVVDVVKTLVETDKILLGTSFQELPKSFVWEMVKQAWSNHREGIADVASGDVCLRSYIKHLAARWDLPENYLRREDGVLHYTPGPTITYDKGYIEKYQKLPDADTMAYLRLGALVTALNNAGVHECHSVLDVGYGDGSFLRGARRAFTYSYGTDISTFPVPTGVTQVAPDAWQTSRYQVICFFDSLEHFDNIDFVKSLNCEFVFISVPNCHYRSKDWFNSWRHQRPGEHIFHFSEETLDNFFRAMGFTPASPLLDHEDIIRVNNEQPELNILARLYRKVSP